LQNNKQILPDSIPTATLPKDTANLVALIKDTIPKDTLIVQKPEKEIVKLDLLNYVIPLEDLIRFFDDKYNILTDVIIKKDKRVRDSIAEGNRIIALITGINKELTDFKNADAKKYSNDIFLPKKKLADHRLRYSQYNTNMLVDGTKIGTELKEFSEQLNKDLDTKFSDVSQNIKKTRNINAQGSMQFNRKR